MSFWKDIKRSYEEGKRKGDFIDGIIAVLKAPQVRRDIIKGPERILEDLDEKFGDLYRDTDASDQSHKVDESIATSQSADDLQAINAEQGNVGDIVEDVNYSSSVSVNTESVETILLAQFADDVQTINVEQGNIDATVEDANYNSSGVDGESGNNAAYTDAASGYHNESDVGYADVPPSHLDEL